MTWRDGGLVVVISLIIAVLGAFSLNAVLPVIELWRYGITAGPAWPGGATMIGTYAFTAWLVGAFMPAFVTSLLLTGTAASQRWFRVLAAVVGACCLILGGLIVALRPGLDHDSRILVPMPWLHLVIIAAGFGASLFVVLRRRIARPPARRARALIIGITLGGAIALGAPTLMETHAEYRSQTLRPFRLEFVSAYPISDAGLAWLQRGRATGDVGPVEPGEDREIVELDGLRYSIHHENKLVISSHEIRRIRWIETPDGPAITIRLGGNARAALAGRSDQRLSRHDALYVDGTLVMIPVYNAVLAETLALHDPDRAALRRLYDRLVAD